MLKNSFYAVASQSLQEQSISATINIHPDHEIFEGHFPGKPVVPGVCMIQITKELLEQQTGTTLLFSKGNQIKFLQLLVPDKETPVEVNINWKTTEDGLQTTADFKKDEHIVFKLSGTFRVIETST